MILSRLITPYNRTVMDNKQNKYLVIHYVGAVSTAENNARYFYNADRQASAHYFVDENSVWQVVEEKDAAWHIGAKKYYNNARNSNSIGIEMCCKKKDGVWYIEPETIENTLWLSALIIKKYDIPLTNVVRHYDCTRKNCPEPFVRDEKQWIDFKSRLEKMMEATQEEKIEFIKEKVELDDNTIKYFKFYKYGDALIDKLYKALKNG